MIPAKLRIVMGMDVDEARREHLPFGVDLGLATRGHLVDLDDAIASDRHIARKGGCASAVNNKRIADDKFRCGHGLSFHALDKLTTCLLRLM